MRSPWAGGLILLVAEWGRLSLAEVLAPAIHADRDFHYGDPTFPPEEPVTGLLSKPEVRKELEAMGYTLEFQPIT